jgi:hypothetical protein
MPENIIVSVARDGTDVFCANIFVMGMRVRPRHSNLGDSFDHHELTQREVCFALGIILLEIFSQGDSFLLHSIKSGAVHNDENDDDDDLFSSFLFGDLDLNSESETLTLALKRSTPSTAARSGIKFAKAKVFLEEQGLPLSICRRVSDLLKAEEYNQFVS